MRTYLRIIIVFILLAIMICEGCFRPSQPGPPYKTIKITRGIAHYSFEISTYYKLRGIDTSHNYYSGAGFDAPNVNDMQFGVSVWPVSKEVPNAQDLMNARVEGAILEQRAWGDELQVLDDSEIKVDGVPAYQIMYSGLTPGFKIKGYEKRFSFVKREVYFDYNGMVWYIHMYSDSSKADINNAEFDHILKTFRFLP